VELTSGTVAVPASAVARAGGTKPLDDWESEDARIGFDGGR
jgi:hypothetical protein